MRQLARRSLRAAALALALGAVFPAQAQYQLNQQTDAAAIQAADQLFQAGKFGEAMEGYRALLDRAGEGPDALILAVRLAIAANRAGQFQTAYSALSRQFSSPSWAQQDPDLMDRALEEGVDAAAQAGKRDDALIYARQLVELRIRTQGAEAPATLAAQLTIATMLDEPATYDEAKRIRDRALDILQKGDAELYARILNNVAVTVQNKGRLDSAAELFDRLIQAFRARPESAELGIVEFNTAILHRDRRDFDAAIRHHISAIEVLERQTGKNSVETISALGGLGTTYGFAGRPAAAVPLMRDALARAEQSLGPSDDTMIQANNLADILRAMGRFAEAEPLDRKALDWRVVNLGPTHESTLISRKNLGFDLIGLGRAADAKLEYDQLIAALEQTRGPDDALTKKVKRDGVRLAMLTGEGALNSVELEELDEDAEPTAENVQLANLLSGVAEKKGDKAAELKLNRLALKLADAYYGALHQRTLVMLANVARAERQQDLPEATATYTELERRTRLWSRREYASTNDEAVLEQVAQSTRESVGDILAYAFKAAPKDPKAQQLFATVLAEWKAVGSLERAVLQNAEATLPEADKALLEKVRALRAQTLAQPRGRADGMDDVERELAIAEASLADRVAGLRNADDGESYAAVTERLQPDEAIIDYMVASVKTDAGVVDRVFARVSRSGGKMWLYDLGALDDVAAPLLEKGSSYDATARRTLYDTLIAKLEPKLEGSARLHVVPDGILNLVPFDGLLAADGRNLVETHDVRIARNARAISAGRDRAVEPGGVLLVGDVDYGKGSQFAALPNTRTEIDHIAKVVGKASFGAKEVSGEKADEAALRAAAPGNRILHFATHGFFNPVSQSEAAPLWRAGVALKGANLAVAAQSPGDDGILHAAELASWPLDGVELVVLSACDTAQGDRSYVEGLSGLPSALAAAGVKRSLLARWPIDDRGAANFMVRFYENLLAKKSYPVALRQTKLDAIAGSIDGVGDDTWLAFALIENERSDAAPDAQPAVGEATVVEAGAVKPAPAAADTPAGTCGTDTRSAEAC